LIFKYLFSNFIVVLLLIGTIAYGGGYEEDILEKTKERLTSIQGNTAKKQPKTHKKHKPIQNKKTSNNSREILIDYWQSGAIKASISIKDGKFDGYSYLYYPNGMIKYKAKYKNNLKHGLCISYKENGAIKQKNIYINGLLIQAVDYYDSGIIKSSTNYKNNQIAGKYIEYYQSGAKKFEIIYGSHKALKGKYYDIQGRKLILNKEQLNRFALRSR